MFFFCFFYKHILNVTCWGERAGLGFWWWLWGGWLSSATLFRCILICSVWRNLILRMSVAEKRGYRREGSRDLSCWYLRRNHLDMNYSPPNGNPYSSSFPKALLRGCRWEAAFLSPSYPLPHPCSLIKTPTDLKALHHPLTCIEFPVPHHWVYGPSLGLLMTWHRVTHMNMEISHRVHILPYIAGLYGISTVFFDWWYHPSALQALLDNVAFLTSIICLFKKPSPLKGSCEWQFSATQTPAASSIQSAA